MRTDNVEVKRSEIQGRGVFANRTTRQALLLTILRATRLNMLLSTVIHWMVAL